VSVNKVILMGNLGRDPELRKTNGGTSVVNFSVACSEKWTDKQGQKQEKTEWVNCLAWGKTADNISKFFTKGSEIYVEGKLETRSWDDNGATKYKTEVNVQEFQFTGGSTRKQGENQQPNNQQDYSFQPQQNQNSFEGFPSDEKLPF